MATLYEIDAEIQNCIDSESGEVIDEDKLNALLMERNVKLENVGLWIKNLESDALAIKAERDALSKRMKSLENKAQSLRNWLSYALGGERFETARLKVTFKPSTTTEVDEALLPKKWSTKTITYKPDKIAIKAALLAGKKIKGAHLEEHQNIQIK